MTGDTLVWWRDDDAGRYHARLDRLLALAAATGRPLGLAVVPAWLDDASARRVQAVPGVHVMQHGWVHADHAPAGAKSIELGGIIELGACRAALRQGASILRTAFGDRFLPVMVPPWNRIDKSCLEVLAGLGFAGLSTFADDARGTSCGLVHINTHIDVIDWRGTRRMKPLEQLLDEVDGALSNPELAVLGLLSHHLEMSLDDMERMRQLMAHVDRLGRCRWVGPASLFSER